MKLATITSLALLAATGSAHALDWSINTLSAAYGTNYRHPNNPNEYDAKIVGFVHVSGDKLGVWAAEPRVTPYISR